MQAKELGPVLKLLQEHGFHTCLDTNGYALTDEVKECLRYSDHVLPDLKQMHPEKHKNLNGLENRLPLDFIKYLDEQQKTYWIRYVVVPGYTNEREDVEAL